MTTTTTSASGSGSVVDLRSDTVTKPTRAMRDAMANAEVGDDVFGEDPTVRALEAEIARITGKEAALFVSSGTMGNQLAIALHTRPGDEVIVGEGAHPAFYESGAAPVLSGVQFIVAGAGGMYTADEMEAIIKPNAYWCPNTSLVSVENTLNRAGGLIFPQKQIIAIGERAKSRGLAFYLDGARLWNASAATGIAIDELCAPVDTVSICFSKGLGAPVGSAICTTRANVERARRLRKMWGGGMRQVGILAAGALYAIEHHRDRLKDDHANAKAFAATLARVPGVTVATPDTNIVAVNTSGKMSADDIAKIARERGVLLNAISPTRLRVVTHLDVSADDVARAAQILATVIGG